MEWEAHVLGDAEVVEDGGHLELDPDAALDAFVGPPVGDVVAIVVDRPGARGMATGDQLQERGLPGAVRADEAAEFVLVDREVDVVDGGEAAEALRESVGLQERPRSPAGRGGRRRGIAGPIVVDGRVVGRCVIGRGFSVRGHSGTPSMGSSSVIWRRFRMRP